MSKIQNSNLPLPKPNTDVFYKGRRVPKEYMDVAQGMETQFINHMLEELNKSALNGEKDSFSEQYYKSLLNQERAKIMAATRGGVGLKDIILDQLLPQQQPPVNNNEAINAFKAVSMKGGENE